MTKTAEVNEFSGRLAELVKQVQAGNEVVLTQGSKPVAKIVPATEEGNVSAPTIEIRSLKGHRVLTPEISQSDLADEMFTSQ
jgi:prevent-host-death family protein